MSYPKYEKVDEHNIRVIVERGDVVSLSKLLENKKLLEQKVKEYQDKLDYISQVIAEAEKLGVQPLPEPTIAPKEQENDK